MMPPLVPVVRASGDGGSSGAVKREDTLANDDMIFTNHSVHSALWDKKMGERKGKGLGPTSAGHYGLNKEPLVGVTGHGLLPRSRVRLQ